MKVTLLIAVLCGLLTASCAHPLEQLVDEHHQQRINDANAQNSVSGGVADGLGTYIAESRK